MSVVDDIKDRLDIAEVIQSYVPLKKAGRNYNGLCPFHAEKTPSFVVFPHTGTWHCFGACNTGGDVFTFVMKQENLDFGEALRTLAQRAGVELEPRSPEADAAEQRLALLREINQVAATYFHHLLLNSDEAVRARAYLDERGLNREIIDRFQIGYALDRWDGLLRYLTSKGYALADIAEAGLIVERETVDSPNRSGQYPDGQWPPERVPQTQAASYYDRFRGRVVFPIRDHQGKVIGFGGRVLGEGVPKYLNSPQTPLFDKSSVLFGLDQARAGIRTTGEAVIVEGYMDVLMAHQYGINNVLAQMGTALTEAQLQRLKRYTQRFILALDSDAAGDQATLRGLDVARQVMDRQVVPVPTPRGLIRFEERLAADIRIISLPPGRDPDEVIRDDPNRWAQLVAGAKPIMEYYFEALTADLDLASAKGKAEATRRLGPLVAELGDRVQRTHYLQQLARIVQVDERTLWQQIQTLVREGGPREAKPRAPSLTLMEEGTPGRAVTPSQEQGLRVGLDEYCLSYLLVQPDLMAQADRMFQQIGDTPFQPEDLNRPDDRAILVAWRHWLERERLGIARDVRAEFYDTLDDSLQYRVDALLQIQEAQPPVPVAGANGEDLVREKVLHAIIKLRLRNLQHQVEKLRFLHEDSLISGDGGVPRSHGQLVVELVTRIGRLERAISAMSMSRRRQNEDAAMRVHAG